MELKTPLRLTNWRQTKESKRHRVWISGIELKTVKSDDTKRYSYVTDTKMINPPQSGIHDPSIQSSSHRSQSSSHRSQSSSSNVPPSPSSSSLPSSSHPAGFTLSSTHHLERLNGIKSVPQNRFGWDMLFREASLMIGKSHEEKECYRECLNRVAANFPCGVCARHTRQYLVDNDIRRYYDINEELNGKIVNIGVFKYLWELKNDVNRRLGKPQIKLIDAYKLYN